ncbi:MAG: peptidoglycan-binding protein [Oscillospiraceae bacterium]|jgi:peptidoglycan hydrolase-like protein with peptidoglycan-binding domain|nr:peptidoglycan-binding protein [Oscillospiraceae bacterium]
MGQGTLKAEVRTANGALPVEGAQVIISDKGGQQLYTLTTNADGQTDSVSLSAPDSATTMQPGGEAYAAYNVTVTKDGYIGENIVGAEVLDGIYQTQPVYLYPRYESGEESETVVVPDSSLKHDPPAGQQPKPTPSPFVPFTLADVVIPSRITVHMGAPSSTSAKNISVSFPNYVKNAAASEIYATWPQASLEANIQAIISLALNRVYTEWYRTQGYNFDITNDTRYDQYYKEGQTIPDNISQIVDRIFQQYIRRTGYKEPLFSSYCDGVTAACPGMSQWGTVSLANSGYSAMNILKYYYGNNIELAQTDRISDVLTSYPGYTLSQGSMNASVAVMQSYLNRIAGNFPALPKVTPDGRYGANTAAAVREFQKLSGLPQTGVIDRAAWNKINFYYLSVTKLAELGSEGQRVGIGANPPTATISQGSAGGNVVQLQFLINAIAAYYNGIPVLLEDGAYGPATASAVKAFQKQFGLTQDGIAGPATWKKLYEVYKSLNLDSGGGDIPVYPGAPLKTGSRGGNVDLIQSLLNALADDHPSIPRVIRDGIFGATTQAQVTAFQRLFGLTPDGVVGPATWNAIMNAYFYGDTGSAAPPPASAPPYPGVVLQQGSVGESVRVLQNALIQLSNRFSSIPKVTADGIFGPATQAAVLAAQKALGLDDDGLVGPLTWDAVVGGAVTPVPAYPGAVVQQGSYGESVRTVQIYINKLAGKNSAVPKVAVDGVFSAATHAAVLAAQRALGLTQDGIVGPATWAALVK